MSPRLLIIGAGPGGLALGFHLKQAGFLDFTILEKADGVGGVWRHNTYPGAACDVQSHLYSFAFAPKHDWSRPYGSQKEILAYMEDVADRFGLNAHIRFNVEATGAAWDEGARRWTVRTAAGEALETEVLVSALGLFNEPAIPAIPGLDDFEGEVFHSARWRHDHDLSGRRVGVIGSAASAVQLIPEVAAVAGHLDVFQRTPNWVLPRVDDPYDAETLARFRDEPLALQESRMTFWRNFGRISSFDPVLCAMAEEDGRRNLLAVEDPELRARLTPDYAFGRKRPLRSNVFYPAFNRPNVDLITAPITKITSDALVTAEGERKLDTLVLATGFETARFLSAIDVRGTGGRRLEEVWAEGAQAYLGITSPGFPNCFMMYGPNTNNGAIIYMLECQAAYIVRQLSRMRDEKLAVLEVRQDYHDRYNAQLQRDLDAFEVWREGVNTYYRAASGRIVTQCPYGMPEYREITQALDPQAYLTVAR